MSEPLESSPDWAGPIRWSDELIRQDVTVTAGTASASGTANPDQDSED